jgi:NAD(P)-dependent dehydrogenase (short-subunit alcohol dehydrogenase family)
MRSTAQRPPLDRHAKNPRWPHPWDTLGMSQSRKSANAVVVGTSGGIGCALVEALLADGVAAVHALSRSETASASPRMIAGHIDLQNEASVVSAATRIGETGRVDLIIVATGLLHNRRIRPERTYRSLSAEALAEYFAINVIGPALVAKHFLPLLPGNSRAVFACLSARVGSIGDNRLGGWHGYRASKAALNMLIKTLSIELARTTPNAICVALHPGTVDTELSAPFQPGVHPEKLFTAAFSAQRLLQVIESLTAGQSGGCYAWDGELIPP